MVSPNLDCWLTLQAQMYDVSYEPYLSEPARPLLGYLQPIDTLSPEVPTLGNALSTLLACVSR
ncbi:MAG: hypothetical protein SAK29_39965 [Scytonema sp. PMC 1069.18]|nr:hypothetical protein [Scytonema sp. PMC 1069.18]MEC4886784.1 hypothetical protein [Scytonema sp. PMC 1070.18]